MAGSLMRYATLLLPLRVLTETPYAKTPYQQWEEDTYYPHSRGGPYQACLKAHLVPKPNTYSCLLYTSPSPRDATLSRMPSSA